MATTQSGSVAGEALRTFVEGSCHTPQEVANEMPSHEEQLVNLRRIEGQIRGLQKMIEDRRYCLDILNQCRSVHAALESVEKKIFKRFLSVCVRKAFDSGDDQNIEPLMDDIVKLMARK